MDNSELLDHLAQIDPSQAWTAIVGLALDPAYITATLAVAALDHAETEPRRAGHWLDVAQALLPDAGGMGEDALAAQIAYARARLHLLAGEMPAAEESLLHAQALWSAVGDELSLVRSGLGLTQILTMQGRYAEAESRIEHTIERLTTLAQADPTLLPRLIVAHRNYANLLRFQEKHQPALDEYERALQLLTAARNLPSSSGAEQPAQEQEEAHLLLNMANVLMSLDRPADAEFALEAAIASFDGARDTLNRGRARSNLGSLYLRTGRYAAALAQFDRANADLLGDGTLHRDLPLDQLRQADVTLLDQAIVYVTLNLLPEARNALALSLRIFLEPEADQPLLSSRPYEVGQTYYSLALVHMRSAHPVGALDALTQAEQIFHKLDNRYWFNRTRLALAAYHYGQGAVAQAQAVVYQLAHDESRAHAEDALAWDLGTRTELYELQVRLLLEEGKIDQARTVADQMAHLLKSLMGGRDTLPHLHMRLHHTLGRLALVAGERSAAHKHLREALHLLESQRVTLPLEEFRSAFLHDKATLYSDLIVSLLDDESPALADAFALAERARARALLERLFATVPDADTQGMDDHVRARRSQTRQHLHWLYNQLLDGASTTDDVRRWQHEIWTHEATLQTLERQSTAFLQQAQTVRLDALQQALSPGEQAIVYFIAGAEVLAFIVDRRKCTVVRRLCSIQQLNRAGRELRFQLGRAELGRDYLARNAKRLHSALHSALHELYTMLYAPVAHLIHRERLLFIPHGSIHLVPLHLLWTGSEYLLQRVECRYAPSASLAVHCRNRQQQEAHRSYGSLAGFALHDETIPHAVSEVEHAGAHFDTAWIHVDAAADHAALRQRAAQADILHMATHGLFRADNPFFSALKLADGWIDVRAIYRLNLQARLVVLSACKSGSGRIGGGDEVVGLARGFLGAGAHALLSSAWNVHDASAATLMERFYTHLVADNGAENGADNAPATALRAAQAEAARRGEHPYFWGSFFIIG